MDYLLLNILDGKGRFQKRKFKSWFHKLKWLNNNDYNVNILMVGRNRIGKTYGALDLVYSLNKFFQNGIAESWDTNKPIKFWIFNLLDLIKKTEEFKKMNIPIWLVYEEVGESLGSHEWWSLPNRIFAKITQTWGSLKINLVMTLPKSKELSTTALAQIHYGIEVTSRGKGILCRANHRYLGTSKYSKDLFFERLKFIHFNKPRRRVINYYEKDKAKFQEVTYKDYEKQLEASTKKEKKRIEKQLRKEEDYSSFKFKF